MEIKLVVKRLNGETADVENQTDRRVYTIPTALLPIVEEEDVVSVFSIVDADLTARRRQELGRKLNSTFDN